MMSAWTDFDRSTHSTLLFSYMQLVGGGKTAFSSLLLLFSYFFLFFSCSFVLFCIHHSVFILFRTSRRSVCYDLAHKYFFIPSKQYTTARLSYTPPQRRVVFFLYLYLSTYSKYIDSLNSSSFCSFIRFVFNFSRQSFITIHNLLMVIFCFVAFIFPF